MNRGELIEKLKPSDRKIPLEYIWTLSRFDGEKEVTEIGRYLLPTSDIGSGLDEEWILLNLNAENCFDFDYSPQEGDSIKFHQNVVLSPYLSFVYKCGEWVAGHHSPWSTLTSIIGEGKIETHRNNN